MISRGIRTTPQERDEIVPLLTVFAALFGYLLVTIHDTEFYGDDIQEESSAVAKSCSSGGGLLLNDAGTSSRIYTSQGILQASSIWMPFALKELVPMSLSLRDVTIGLVELAFPESRPVVKEEYKQAVK